LYQWQVETLPASTVSDLRGTLAIESLTNSPWWSSPVETHPLRHDVYPLVG
jgi:hypothetical protein